jgi:hypothetical protein
MHNTENLFILLFCVIVHSWVQGFYQMWCLHGAKDALQKVSSKNKFSFH